MVEKQLSIFLENKPGVLAKVCKTLGAQGINIRGLSVSDTVDHAVVRLIVDDPQKAIHVLGDHGALVVETDVLAVQMANQPGELAKMAARLARAKVNIEYAYGSSNSGPGTIFFRVSDVRRALRALSATKAAARNKR